MIDFWFPTAIYVEDNIILKEQNESLKQYCMSIYNSKPNGGTDWYGGTYTTHGSYESSKDAEVSVLIHAVTQHVKQFAKIHGCEGDYNNYSTWMNVSKANDWQEFHSHPKSIFSAVYYVSSPVGSGNIVFEDPREPDMFPLKDVKSRNNLTHTRIPYASEEGRLIIFRSYLRHMVAPGNNKEPRISFALNFN